MTRAARQRERVHLLDGNVLAALVSSTHIDHEAAQTWFAASDEPFATRPFATCPFATCPITQGTRLRLLMRLGEVSSDTALAAVAGVTAHTRYRFWSDSLGYADMSWRGVLGHRQVTDAYLSGMACHHGGRLVSFDSGLVALHADVAIELTQMAALGGACHRRRLAALRSRFESKLRPMAPLSTFLRDT